MCLNVKKAQISLDVLIASLALFLIASVSLSAVLETNSKSAENLRYAGLRYKVLASADYVVKYSGTSSSQNSQLHHVLPEEFAASLPYSGNLSGLENISVRLIENENGGVLSLQNPAAGSTGDVFCVTRLVVFKKVPRKLEVCGWQ